MVLGRYAVATDPSLAYPYVVRSLFLSSTGDADAAGRDADVALRLDPEYAAPALALVTAGDTAAARREIVAARAALQDPETPSSTEGYFVALALVAAGDAQEGWSCWSAWTRAAHCSGSCSSHPS